MAAGTPKPLTPEECAADRVRTRLQGRGAATVPCSIRRGHPAIAVTLGRIANVTSADALKAPLTLTVLPDGLLLDEGVATKPDAAINELASLLHAHVIGRMTVHPGGDVEAWRTFLLMIGRSPESVRAEGGIARAWMTLQGRHVELQEIDYAEVLREKSSGLPAAWDQLIASCLQGAAFELDEPGIAELLAVAGDPQKLGELMSAMDAAVEPGGGIPARTAALMRLMRGLIEAVSGRDPDRMENTLRNLATAVAQLSPEMLMGLFDQRGDRDEGPRLMNAVVSRMSDGTVADFVARNVIESNSATDRVVQAFQTLVPDADGRPRLLSLAKDEVSRSPLGSTAGFESTWNHIAEKLMTSYSDESYVSQTYGRELSGARSQAIEVEQVSDDPPERLAAWRSSIDESAQRTLDLAMMLDVLRIEQDDVSWGKMLEPVVRLIEDELFVGDFDAAAQLIDLIVQAAARQESPGRCQHAQDAIDSLVAGPMMRHIATHLATVDEAQFARVKSLCVSLGEVVVRPLAEALSLEQRQRTRERLTAILIAFGASGRRTVERLKSSPNAAVRRTAIYLLREFGGSEALPDLTELLDDSEPQVQREAVRAILNIGTDSAFDILQKALTSGSERSRDGIVQSITSVRDERAAPLFAYILKTVDHRGPLSSLYLRAIESLGALKDPKGVEPLKESLYRGEWWAPRRTTALRTAAATALARIGTAEAIAALDEASTAPQRGVRAAVRPQLERLKRHGRGAASS
jgi:hypothetical protein